MALNNNISSKVTETTSQNSETQKEELNSLFQNEVTEAKNNNLKVTPQVNTENQPMILAGFRGNGTQAGATERNAGATRIDATNAFRDITQNPSRELYENFSMRRDLRESLRAGADDKKNSNVKIYNNRKYVRVRAAKLAEGELGVKTALYQSGNGQVLLEITRDLTISGHANISEALNKQMRGEKISEKGNPISVEENIGETLNDKGQNGPGFIQAEVVRKNSLTGSVSWEYPFSNIQEAKKFLHDYKEEASSFNQRENFNPFKFEEKYNDKYGHGSSGMDWRAGMNFSLAGYGSYSIRGLSSQKITDYLGEKLPELDTKGADGLFLRGFMGGKLNINPNIQYSFDDPKKLSGATAHTVQTEDTADIGAKKVLSAGLDIKGNYQFYPVIVGKYSVLGDFGSAQFSYNKALIFGNKQTPVQTGDIIQTQSASARRIITDRNGKLSFQDVRVHNQGEWAAHYQKTDTTVNGMVHKMSSFSNTNGNNFENLYVDHKRNEVNENIFELNKNINDHAQKERRRGNNMFQSSPFSRRQLSYMYDDYRRIKNQYDSTSKKVSEQDFSKAVEKHMQPGLVDWVGSGMLYDKKEAEWHDKYIAPNKSAYNKSREQYFSGKSHDWKIEARNMNEHQRFQAYRDMGLMYPANYYNGFDSTISKKESTAGGKLRYRHPVGYSNIVTGNEQRILQRVYKFVVPHHNTDYANKIMKDKVAADAFVRYYNWNGRKQNDEVPIVQYHTATKWDKHQRDETGHTPDFGKGVYRITNEDLVTGDMNKTFHNIALKAGKQLGHDVSSWSEEQIKNYAQDLLHQNFQNLSDKEVEDNIFHDAHILLRTPGNRW